MATAAKGMKIEWTPEQLAEHASIRERYKPGRVPPTVGELVDSGQVSAESVPHAGYMELRRLAHALKARRDELGWGQTEAGERCGLTGPMISNLESGRTINPTLETLYRYALGLGLTIRMAVEPSGEPSPPRR